MATNESQPYCVNGLLAIPKVLFVEAERAAGEQFVGLLNANGFKATFASEQREVARLVRATQFDLIICDELYPSAEHEHLIEFVRREPATASVPIMVLTETPHLTRIRYHKGLEPFSTVQRSIEQRLVIDAIRRSIAVSLLPAHPAEESNEGLRTQIIHTLSHEFRTPLLAINTGVELLIDNWQQLGEEKVKVLLKTVKHGGQRLQKLVNDFMTLQQIEVGLAQQAFNNTARDMAASEILFNYMDSRGCDHQREGAKITIEDQTGDARVRVVEMQVIDCLDRLVSNAIKFSKSDRVAEISVQRDGNNIWFNVKDRGIGLDLGSLQEAIGIFGQIARQKNEQQGSGLGLPIASHFATINGGRLGFQHREGGGSVVSLVLPAAG